MDTPADIRAAAVAVVERGYDEGLLEAVERALMAEREACAKIAEHLNGWGSDCGRGGHAEHIAKMIRRGTPLMQPDPIDEIIAKALRVDAWALHHSPSGTWSFVGAYSKDDFVRPGSGYRAEALTRVDEAGKAIRKALLAAGYRIELDPNRLLAKGQESVPGGVHD